MYEMYFCHFRRMYMSLCICVSHVRMCPWRSGEGIRYFAAGVTGGCERPHLGLGRKLLSSFRAAHIRNCYAVSLALEPAASTITTVSDMRQQ